MNLSDLLQPETVEWLGQAAAWTAIGLVASALLAAIVAGWIRSRGRQHARDMELIDESMRRARKELARRYGQSFPEQWVEFQLGRDKRLVPPRTMRGKP